jgi:phosphate transport system substrate-binding protein
MSTDASAEPGPRARRPSRIRRHLTAVLAATAAAALVAPVGVLAAASSGLGASPALASGPEINGGGSSYAAPAIENWVTQVASLGTNVNYSVSSSVVGLNLYAQNLLNFGASEIGYSTGQMNYTPNGAYQYLPDVAGATCMMFNLKGRLGNQLETLKLNSQVMADIFTGTITTWNAPQIEALNAGTLLPKASIIPVFRTDASGDNFLFSDYLNFMQPNIWQPFVKTLQAGEPVQAVWPQGTNHGKYNLTNFVGQSGSDGSSNFVAANNDTVTYVETAYAILHHLPCAYVENASGNWVAPTATTDAVGLERAQLLPDLEQKLDGVYTNPLPDAYPISAYSYLVTPKRPTSESPAVGAVLGSFIHFFACTGQQSAVVLGYSPLPPNLVDEDFAAINRIPGAARVPAQATASNCQNPYVDGQLPLPGEPCIQGQACNNGGGGGGGTTTTTVPAGGGGGSTKTGGSQPGGGKTTTTTTTVPTGKIIGPGGPGGGGGGSTAVANGLWPGEKIVPAAKPGASLSNGETPGYQLATADLTLLGVPLSTTTMWLSVGVLLLVIATPPLVARRRRRNRARPATATTAESP